MRRYRFISIFLLTIVLAGCHDDIKVGSSDMSGEDAWIYDLSLPVPVELSASSVSTKSAINSTSDMVNKYFGVFAVDKNTDDLRADDGLNMRNQNTRYDAVEGFRFGYPSERRQIFYPQSGDADFDFYTYYAFTKDDNVEIFPVESSARSISVLLPVARATDVLYGKASTGEGMSGYNAEYARRYKGEPSYRPSFNLVHPTSGLSVAFRMDEASERIADNDSLILASITLKDIPEKAKLRVVDLDDPSAAGTFEVVSRKDKKLQNGATGNLACPLYHNALNDGVTGLPVTDDTDAGDDIFIVPQQEPLEAVVTFVLKSLYTWPNTGETVISNYRTFDCEITLDPAEFGIDAGYVAGKMYNYRLVLSFTYERGPEVLRVEPDVD